MKIGIYIGSTDPRSGGESNLTRRIIKEVLADKDSSLSYVFLYTYDQPTPLKKKIHNMDFINISHCCGPLNWLKNGFIESMGGASNRFFELDKIAKKEKIDMIYFAAPVFALTSIPYIYTVWDLGHRTVLYSPEVSGKEWGVREKMYRLMLQRATFVITGNEQGKKELLQFYRLDPSRIKIVPFPVSGFCYGEEKKPEIVDEQDYFFYPAQFWPHKNHICILDALLILKKEFGLTPRVYFTGTDKGNLPFVKKKIMDYGLDEQVKLTGFVSDREMKYLYTHARAMIFASLMGPNNLPPIEAMYLGCPVIITDLLGHKEQLGESALYFNGYDGRELADKMKEVLEGNLPMLKSREELIASGMLPSGSYYEMIKKQINQIKTICQRWK